MVNKSKNLRKINENFRIYIREIIGWKTKQSTGYFNLEKRQFNSNFKCRSWRIRDFSVNGQVLVLFFSQKKNRERKKREETVKWQWSDCSLIDSERISPNGSSSASIPLFRVPGKEMYTKTFKIKKLKTIFLL